MSNFLKLLIMNKKEIAKALLSAGAVKFFPNPKDAITFKSGIKSPIYCNNREMTRDPDCYNPIMNGFMEVIDQMWDEYDSHADVIIVGVPMGALFWASVIAFDFSTGYTFVRQEAKDHGMKSKIDGHPLGEGTKVIIIEDLISTGGSCLDVVEAVRATGAEVIGVAAIVTYGWPKTIKRFEEAGVKLKTLTDYATIVRTGVEMKLFSAEDGAVLENWHHAPENWGQL